MAGELILILADFFPHAQRAPAEQALPRIAALETLLARSRRGVLPQGWRGWFSSHYATPELAAMSPAAIASLATPESPQARGTQQWLATPLHYFAGLDSVHLHPAGLLQLNAAEQAELAADFATVFADTPWRLHAIGGRELLLSGEPLAASGADPAQFAGCDPSAGLPQGPHAATLRRLGVEIEMWLHEHRVNQRRLASRELPVTTLWFWGSVPEPGNPARRSASAAMASVAQPRLAAARLYGRDVYAESLWRLRGLKSEALPQSFQSMPPNAAGVNIVLWPSLSEDGLTATLQRFETDWLAPALQALRARQLAAIQLFAAGAAHRLRRLDLARFWLKCVPWWERLG